MFARRIYKDWICIGDEVDFDNNGLGKGKDIRESIEILLK